MTLPTGATALLDQLLSAGVAFIVVGGGAAVMQGAPLAPKDLDIVHARTPENVERLLSVLRALRAFDRADLANRRLAPKADALLGHGHVLLTTDLGELDVLCEIDGDKGYDELFINSVEVSDGERAVRVLDLPTLIEVKARAGRPKDRLAIPVLVATLQERLQQEK